MRTQDLRSRLRQEGEARVLIPTLTAGLVIGIVEVVLAASFAALIFSGRLAPYLPQAIGLILWSAIAVMVVVGLGTSLSGLVASIQDVSAAILAVMAAAIAQRVHGSGDEAFLSTVLAIILTSLLTGGFFFLLGTFRLGNLVRFIRIR